MRRTCVILDAVLAPFDTPISAPMYLGQTSRTSKVGDRAKIRIAICQQSESALAGFYTMIGHVSPAAALSLDGGLKGMEELVRVKVHIGNHFPDGLFQRGAKLGAEFVDDVIRFDLCQGFESFRPGVAPPATVVIDRSRNAASTARELE